MDVHKLLGNVIASLSSDNILSSWSVYKENNGYISVKIRYMEGPCEPNHNVNSNFRRKSQRQFNRDKARHQQWKESKRSCSNVAAAENHLVQSDTAISDYSRHGIPSEPVTPEPAITKDTIDEPLMSPVVTRSMAKAAIPLDTPETVRHDDTACSTVDISDVPYLDMNDANFPVDDPMSSDTEADIIRYSDNNSSNSSISDDTDVVRDSGSHDVDDPRVNHDSTPPYNIKSNITEWEPPPRWCLACWFKDSEKCLKHS